MANCQCCFEDTICHCIPYDDVIRINTQLSPSETYTWVITDKFENEYSGSVEAEPDGSVEIPIAALPDGLINQFGGKYLLRFEDGNCGGVKVPLAKKYDCIEFTVIGGTRQKNEIGCEVACIGGGSTNVRIDFEGQSTLSIDYSGYIEAIGNNPLIQVYGETSPNIYQLVNVAIEQIRSNGVLTDIEIDFGGPLTGYVLLS